MANQYDTFSRTTWQNLPARREIPITQTELDEIRSINDHLSFADIIEIYAPLIQLLAINIRHHQTMQEERQLFLHQKSCKIPFLIGITGSVAVGKSTTARLLQKLLQWYYPQMTVDLITTDGFLYSTDELTKRNLLSKKGFPESYRTNYLIETLTSLKSGVENIHVPLYSHESYDIIKDKYKVINQPDILIVEGINVLQSPSNQQVYLSDFFDFSIYIDAATPDIKEWYLDRFKSLLKLAKTRPDNYYYQLANGPLDEALALAHDAWENINQPNLEHFILPTKYHANLILHKGKQHIIDQILLRRY